MLLVSLLYSVYLSQKILVRINKDYATTDMDIWSQSETTADVFTQVKALKNIPYKVLDTKVEERARLERQRLSMKKKLITTESFFDDFRNLKDILGWYDGLKTEFPGYVCKVVYGKSVQNRDLIAYHFTMNNNKPKKQMLMMSLIHSREWLSAPVVAYTVYNMLTENKAMLDTLELVVIPVVNPDGYVYTWESNRYWRKNMGANGKGVDLNRNFDIHFDDKGGASTNPSSDAYKGPFAFSEPETMHLKNYYAGLKTVVGALDVHCFSQLILRPLGYGGNTIHEEQMKALGDGIAKEIYKVDKQQYRSMKIIDLYKTTGSSIDYFYEQKKMIDNKSTSPYAMAYELRPQQRGGDFVVKPSLIAPTSLEILKGNLFFFRQILDHPLQ